MEKQNKILKVIIVILVFVLILVIGIGAGYFRTKVKNVTIEEKASKEKIETNQSQNTTNETENTKTVIQTREMTSAEKYAIYSKGVQNKIKDLGKDLPKDFKSDIFFNEKHVISIDEFPAGGTHVNEKMEAYVDIKETGDHIKILDNAIDCGICSSGNDGTRYLIWAVDVNGDLYTQYYDTNDTANRMKFNLSKKQDMKNIISVIQCAGVSTLFPVAIDIDGNTYDV